MLYYLSISIHCLLCESESIGKYPFDVVFVLFNARIVFIWWCFGPLYVCLLYDAFVCPFLFFSNLFMHSTVYLFICDKSHFAYNFACEWIWYFIQYCCWSIQISNDILYEPSFSMLSKYLSHMCFPFRCNIYCIQCFIYYKRFGLYTHIPFKIDALSCAKYLCKTTYFDAKIHWKRDKYLLTTKTRFFHIKFPHTAHHESHFIWHFIRKIFRFVYNLMVYNIFPY